MRERSEDAAKNAPESHGELRVTDRIRAADREEARS